MMNYRIGLSGPSGGGKTTLAHFIENELDLTFMPGSASIIHDEEAKKFLREEYNYEPKGHRNVINLSNENPKFGYDFQKLLLQSRAKKLKESDNFVTDRTPIDNVAYFLMQCSHNQSEAACEHFIAEATLSAMDGLTHLILVKPNMGWTENNDSRVSNNYYQHMSYAVFEYVFLNFFKRTLLSLGIKVLVITEWDLKTRKSLLREFFKNPEPKLFA